MVEVAERTFEVHDVLASLRELGLEPGALAHPLLLPPLGRPVDVGGFGFLRRGQLWRRWWRVRAGRGLRRGRHMEADRAEAGRVELGDRVHAAILAFAS